MTLPAITAGIATCVVLHRIPLRGDVFLLSVIVIFIFSVVGQRLWMSSSGVWVSLHRSGVVLAWHTATSILATVIYRLSPFHPLASFPGPIINRITNFKLAHTVYTGKRHLIIADLHRKYGVFVRTGPYTLSINSHAAVSGIYNTARCMNKSEAYRPGRFDARGLFFIRNLKKHNERRRIWSGAFATAALESASVILSNRTHELISCISKRQHDGAVDLGECIQHWSYDVMGDLTFGGSSRIELMKDGDRQNLVSGGRNATVLFEVLGEMPLLFDIMSYLSLLDDVRSLHQLSLRLLEARRQVSAQDAHPDICSHLLSKDVQSGAPHLNNTELNSDVVLAIQAGSDTTSGVLILTMYHILADEAVHDRLKDELRGAFHEKLNENDHPMLLQLQYLSAVITEGLRLGAPLPGLPRVVPEDGLTIDNVFIPAGTIVGAPPWSQHISPENFWPEPEKFIPERWLGGLGEGSVARKNAIMTFSFGPFGCPGRNLAVKELHVVIAQLLLSYDMKLSVQFNHRKFQEGIKNMRTTFFVSPLAVEAVPRKRSAVIL